MLGVKVILFRKTLVHVKIAIAMMCSGNVWTLAVSRLMKALICLNNATRFRFVLSSHCPCLSKYQNAAVFLFACIG